MQVSVVVAVVVRGENKMHINRILIIGLVVSIILMCGCIGSPKTTEKSSIAEATTTTIIQHISHADDVQSKILADFIEKKLK